MLNKILKAIPKAVARPTWGFRIVSRRFFGFRGILDDPETYQAVSSRTFGKAPRKSLRLVMPGIESTDVTALRAYDRLPQVGLNSRELLAICTITRFLQPQRILEIGTSDGNTTLNLAANSPDSATVTTIDLPLEWDGEFALNIRRSMDNVTGRDNVGRQFEETHYRTRIRQVLGDSAALDWNDLDGPFDLVVIDGCHDISYVRKDTENSLEHLGDASSGMIMES